MTENTEGTNEPGRRSGKKKQEKAPFLTLRESETRLIREALEYTNWNMKRTASLLAISRPALYRRIEKLKITRETPSSTPPETNNPSSSGETDTSPTIKADAAAGFPSAMAV